MKTNKKLKIQMSGRSDEFMTPKYAIKPLLPYLKKSWTIWECAWGKGSLAKHLEKRGFKVIGEPFWDFLNKDLGLNKGGFDIIVTNPPYSLKDKFLERCYELGKPFALLMPLTALEGKARGELYRKYGIQLIIPNKRIFNKILNILTSTNILKRKREYAELHPKIKNRYYMFYKLEKEVDMRIIRAMNTLYKEGYYSNANIWDVKLVHVDDNILSNMNERINLLEESNKVIARELSRISENFDF